MPIYVVGARNQRVRIPAAALSVSVTGAVGGAELEIRCPAEQPVVRSSAHHAVLPALRTPITVAVTPVGVSRFAAGTVIHLAIAHDNPGDVDPVQVLFDPVDVSGEGAIVFATLTPAGQQIDVAVAAVADTALSPLSAAARSTARNVVGRGPAHDQTPVLFAVETSASMRSWFADGSVAAAADIVVGVADALGLHTVSAVLVGADVTPVRPAPGGELASALREAAPRWSAGARWSRLAPGPARTVVCADFPTSAVAQRFPVITLSDDPRADRLGARLPAPRPGQYAAAELLAHRGVLERITAPLARALAGPA